MTISIPAYLKKRINRDGEFLRTDRSKQRQNQTDRADTTYPDEQLTQLPAITPKELSFPG